MIIYRLALLQFAVASEVARSPFAPQSWIESYAETATDRFVVQYTQNDSGFKIVLISKANPSSIEIMTATRQLFLDGGSRIFRFRMNGQDVELFMPAKRGITEIPGYGVEPILRLKGHDVKVDFSSIYPLEEVTKKHLIHIYPEIDQAEFAATQKFPSFDPFAKSESKCGFLVSKLKGLFER